jgi:hypothetical protein
MRPNRQLPGTTPCIWCSVGPGKRVAAANQSNFCSRRCEIEANFWLFQELCEIEITHPPGWHQDDHNG